MVLGEATAVQSGRHRLFVQGTALERTQFGALCWRSHADGLQILLVTSRDTGRWVIPKGWPCDGLDPEASAAREAWEEAGVEGAVDPRCLGLFSYDKGLTAQSSIPCVVGVYGLRVQRLQRRFPERKERRRKWFSLEKAARKVDEADLCALILSMNSILPMPVPVGTAAADGVETV